MRNRGDMVRIKSIDWYEMERDHEGFIRRPGYRFAMVPGKQEWCGKVVRITLVHDDLGYRTYQVDNNNAFNWHDWMFENDEL